MRYRSLGTTGTQVSVLCLGAMTFGEADASSFMHKVGSDEAESFAVIDRALDLGAADLELSAALVKRLEDASAPPLGYPYEMLKNLDGAW
jgi:predicted aldo/keto reductase-like oxidoreductase